MLMAMLRAGVRGHMIGRSQKDRSQDAPSCSGHEVIRCSLQEGRLQAPTAGKWKMVMPGTVVFGATASHRELPR